MSAFRRQPPPGWSLTRLGSIGRYLNGRGFKKSEWGDHGRPIIRIQNLTGSSEQFNYFLGSVDAKNEVQAGDLLMSWAATLGAYIWRGPRAVLNQHIFKVESHIDRAFHYYVLRWALEELYRNAHGTGMVHVTKAKFDGTPVFLPPTREQQRIVEAIDSYFSRLDDALATLERVQHSLKRYRASVLKAAAEGRLAPTEGELARVEGRTYEPAEVLEKRILTARRHRWEDAELAKMTAKGKVPKDESWKAQYVEPVAPDTGDLPRLPDGWCWTSLGRLFDVRIGSTPSRAKPEYWNGGIPWVSSGEVSFCRIASTRETISEAGLANSSTQLHPAGSVLLGMIGEGKTRGQAAILNIAACNSQNSASIRVSESGLPPEYVFYFLMEQYEVTRARGSGNNQPALNKSRVESIPIPLPPLAEACRIVAGVSQHVSVIDSLESEARRGVARCARLRRSILKWAFEGRLVDQEPTDEPASALLERIRAERLSERGAQQGASADDKKPKSTGRRKARTSNA